MAPTQPPTPGTMSRRRAFTVLALIVLFTEIASFEILMIYPAVPAMTAKFETTHIAWVTSILNLAGATVMPLIGKAADKWGKKRVIVVLGGIFVLGSVVCAFAPSLPMMLVGRALQGCLVGVVTMSYSLVRDIMPRDFVPIALGTVVTGIGMSAIAGPFLGGLLLDSFGYTGIFWFLALYVIVLLPFFGALVPESPIRVTRPIDVLGTVLLGPGLAVLLLGVTQGSQWGWGAASTLFCLVLGTAMLVGFVCWERVCPHPLIDLKVLLGRKFGPTVLAVACVSYMMNAHSFMNPTVLMTPQDTAGVSYGVGLTAVEYALWTCPMGVVGMFVGPLGGYLAKRIGARQVLLASALCYLFAMFFASTLLTVQWQVAITAFVAGFAVGFLHSSNANLVQDALPESQSGVGNSIGGMSTLLTGGVATALTGALMSNHILSVDPKTHSVLYADAAFQNSYYAAAGVGIVGLIVVLVMRHGRAPAQGGLVEQEDDVKVVDAEPPATPKPVG